MHDRGQLEGGGVRAVTWAGTTDTDLVTGSLKQVYKRAIRQQALAGTDTACTGQPATWTAKVLPPSSSSPAARHR